MLVNCRAVVNTTPTAEPIVTVLIVALRRWWLEVELVVMGVTVDYHHYSKVRTILFFCRQFCFIIGHKFKL